MGRITITFDNPTHHTCLMQGLKQTFEQMPWLNKKVIIIGDTPTAMDNIVAPPPMMRNPERKHLTPKTRNIVEVSYWRERVEIEYNEAMCRREEAALFAEKLTQGYLQFRHPFMKIGVESGNVFEASSRRTIAQII